MTKEHNLDVIKFERLACRSMPQSEDADWAVDLGPGGGVNGGEIVVTGTPKAVVAEPRSTTGQYLGPMLDSVMPALLETEPVRPKRSRKVALDAPDLVGAK